MIMAARKRGDIAALDQLNSEFPAGEEVEEFDYLEVDWRLTYDKKKRQINVFWHAKVKLEGGYIYLDWSVIYKKGGFLGSQGHWNNNDIKVLKQGDNYGSLTVTCTPAGPETIFAQIGGIINAPGKRSKVYKFIKSIIIDK